MASTEKTLTVDVAIAAGACKDTSAFGDERSVLCPIASKRKRDDTNLECTETIADMDFDDAVTSAVEPDREALFNLEVQYYSHVFSHDRFFCPIVDSATNDVEVEIPETLSFSDLFLE